VGKGYNEFVMFGEEYDADSVDILGEYYYFFTQMSW